MTASFDYVDKRQEVIDRMNAGRLQTGKAALNRRQEHIVREFFDENGFLAEADRPLLVHLLQSNSV